MTTDLPPSASIDEAVKELGLPVAILELPGVRTFGDLLAVLAREDVPKELAAKVYKALKP